MKKFFAIFFGTLLLVALAAQAYAEIKLSGTMRVRGRQGHQFDLNDRLWLSGRSGEGQYYDQQVRLQLDATVSPNLKAFIEIQHEGGDNATWGITGTGDQSHQGFQGVQSRYFGALRQAWMLYTGKGLGFTSGLKAGHQLLKLGHGLFYDATKYGNDAIVFFMDPTKETHIGLITIKFSESTANVNNDVNGYTALIIHKLDANNKIGIDLTQLRGENASRATTTRKKTDVLNEVGITADGKIAGLTYRADLQIQSGKGDSNFGNVNGQGSSGWTALSTTENIKYSAWAYLVGVDYKVDPVTITLETAGGSGDDSATNKQKAFQTFLGGDPRYTYVYEFRVGQSGLGAAGTGAWSPISFGLSNTIYYKIGLAGKATKDLALSGAYYVLRADKAMAITGVSGGTNRNLGTEFDAKAIYKLAANLEYGITYGVFKPSNFYDLTPKDTAWSVDHWIAMKF
ncbi:MAG: alginate export family protein [Nitrospirota bacterium]